MKKTATLGALLLALALPLAAQAETVFAGEVTAGTTQVIAAPYGGLVEDVRVRVGDSVKIGDPIATVETSKTYASTDGTVSGVFAREGDSADGVKTQYGALVYIEPINRYTLECSTEKGYNSSENRYIHIGESVFLKCTKDGSPQGRGGAGGRLHRMPCPARCRNAARAARGGRAAGAVGRAVSRRSVRHSRLFPAFLF